MKRKLKKKPLSFVKKNLVLILGCFVLLTLSTIGYAALNQALNITGDIAIRAVKDIRITNVALTSTAEDGYEYYNSRYDTDSITISAILPNVDSSVSYSAQITNKGNVDMEVSEISAEIQSSLVAQLSTLAKTQYFECNVEGIDEADIILGGETKTFTITFKRIKSSADNTKNVEAIIAMEFKEYIPAIPYTDPMLMGNDPDLLNGSLTPIVYDGDMSSWVVADVTREWYNYGNEYGYYYPQMWANAVILEDGVTKKVGDPIIVPTASSTETEVKAMYVWIPRYSYTIKSEDGTNYYGKTLSELGGSTASQSTPGAIDIKFVDINTKETGTAKYTGNDASNWLTHPAFTFGTKELTGIWVGKFEPSASTNDTCYSNESETNCTYDKVTPYILPNVKSLRNQNVYNQYVTAQKFSSYLKDDTSIDSHMMKNSEWGAVAYLSQSIYGKYGNNEYIGVKKEIYNNNSSGYYTGRSSGAPSDGNYSTTGTCEYNSGAVLGGFSESCGTGASTTGNIYGVYDMAGGSDENVMAYHTNANRNYSNNPDGYFGSDSYGDNLSGFTFKPDDKYFDNYNSSAQVDKACDGGICYGQALTETKNWYDDNNSITISPWVIRGGSQGIFNYSTSYGSAGNYSFHSVLVNEDPQPTSGEEPDVPSGGGQAENITFNVVNDANKPWTITDNNYSVTGSSDRYEFLSSTLKFEISITTAAKVSFDWDATITAMSSVEGIFYSVLKGGNEYLAEFGPLNNVRFAREELSSKSVEILLDTAGTYELYIRYEAELGLGESPYGTISNFVIQKN